ncbi:MAG: SagB/ThcOx family dehydrogenase [Anaerolineae bacterium]
MIALKIAVPLLVLLLASCALAKSGPAPAFSASPTPADKATAAPSTIALPPPRLKGEMSLEEALTRRRSVREYDATPLTLAELGQLLWAAQGITSAEGFRTAPSAGARYPLEVYAVLPEATYHYAPQGHRLHLHIAGDRRPALYAAALNQTAVLQAPAVIVIAAVYERTSGRYGAERTPRYVHMEVGHAGQNILLQAVALGLGAVPIGAFYDEQVKVALALPTAHQPLYLIPVGHPKP